MEVWLCFCESPNRWEAKDTHAFCPEIGKDGLSEWEKGGGELCCYNQCPLGQGQGEGEPVCVSVE